MKKPCMIAHRGYSAAYPMNTALAFQKAAERHSGGAETDNCVTRDGALVCSHNPEAVLEDGTELQVADSACAQLTAQPLKNLKTDDEVYLSVYLRALSGNHARAQHELLYRAQGRVYRRAGKADNGYDRPGIRCVPVHSAIL